MGGHGGQGRGGPLQPGQGGLWRGGPGRTQQNPYQINDPAGQGQLLDRFGNPIICHACGQTGHFWRQCLVFEQFLASPAGQAVRSQAASSGYGAATAAPSGFFTPGPAIQYQQASQYDYSTYDNPSNYYNEWYDQTWENSYFPPPYPEQPGGDQDTKQEPVPAATATYTAAAA
eukprot:501339-Rhodomonas_salina.1